MQIQIGFDQVLRAREALNSLGNTAVQTANKFDPLISKLKAFALIYVGLKAGDKFLEIANSMTAMSDRLKIASGDMQKFATTSELAYKISQQTASGFKETGNLTARLLPSFEKIGVSAKDTMGFIKSFSQILTMSGASAAESASAITQFGQALNTGTLSGEEFNSIAEAMPKLLEYVSKELGVARGELKGLASEGRISSSVLYKAIAHNSGAINKEFEQLSDRSDLAMQKLTNSIYDAIDKINRSGEISKTVASFINYITVSIEQLSGRTKTAEDNFTSLAKTLNSAFSGDFFGTVLTQIVDFTAEVISTTNSLKEIGNIFLTGDSEFKIVHFDKEAELKKIRDFTSSLKAEISKGLADINSELKQNNNIDLTPKVNEAFFEMLDKSAKLGKQAKTLGGGTLEIDPKESMEIKQQAEYLRLATKNGKEYADTWLKIEKVTKTFQFEAAQQKLNDKMMNQVKTLDVLKAGTDEYNSAVTAISDTFAEMTKNDTDRAKITQEIAIATAEITQNSKNEKILELMEASRQATKTFREELAKANLELKLLKADKEDWEIDAIVSKPKGVSNTSALQLGEIKENIKLEEERRTISEDIEDIEQAILLSKNKNLDLSEKIANLEYRDNEKSVTKLLNLEKELDFRKRLADELKTASNVTDPAETQESKIWLKQIKQDLKELQNLTDEVKSELENKINDIFKKKQEAEAEVGKNELLKMLNQVNIELRNLEDYENTNLSIIQSFNSQMKALEDLQKQYGSTTKDIESVKTAIEKLRDTAIKQNSIEFKLKIANDETLGENIADSFLNALNNGSLKDIFADIGEGFSGNLKDSLKDYFKNFSKQYSQKIADISIGYQVGNLVDNTSGYSKGSLAKEGGAIGGAIGGVPGSVIGSLLGGAFGKKVSSNSFLAIDENGNVTKVTSTKTKSAYGLSSTNQKTYDSSSYYSKTFNDLILSFKLLGDSAIKLQASLGKTTQDIKIGITKQFLGGIFGNTNYQQTISDTDNLLSKNAVEITRNSGGWDGTGYELEEDAYSLLDYETKTAYEFAKAVESSIKVWENASKENSKSLDEYVTSIMTTKQAINREIDKFGKSDSEIYALDLKNLTSDMKAYGLEISTLSDYQKALNKATDPADLEKLISYYDILSKSESLRLEHTKKIENEKIGLEQELAEINGDVAYQRRKEIEALDESNRALKQTIYNLVDYKSALDTIQEATQQQINLFEEQANEYENDSKNAGSRALDLIDTQLNDIIDNINEKNKSTLVTYQSNINSYQDKINNANNLINSLTSLVSNSLTVNSQVISRAIDDLSKNNNAEKQIELLNQNNEALYKTKDEYISSNNKIVNVSKLALNEQADIVSEAEKQLEATKKLLEVLQANSKQDLEYYSANLSLLGENKTVFENLLNQKQEVEKLLQYFETDKSANVNLTTAIQQLNDSVKAWQSSIKTLDILNSNVDKKETALDKSIVLNDIPISSTVNNIQAVNVDALDKAITNLSGTNNAPPSLSNVQTEPIVLPDLTKTVANNAPPSLSNSILNQITKIKDSRFLKPISSYFANGKDEVPYDNFPAYLHKGERVLTSTQTKLSDEVSIKLDNLIELLTQLGVKQIGENIKTNRLLRDILNQNL